MNTVEAVATAEQSKSLQEQARETYRQSVAAEMPISGEALGRMFGRSGRWGRERIAEVRADLEGGGMPVAETGMPVAEVAAETGMPVAEPVAVAEMPEPPVEVERQSETATRGAVAEVAEPGGMPVADEWQPSGRAVAWVAFVLGIAASVAANVLHARHATPEPAAAVAAAFWPVALLLAVEVLTRVRWPRTWPYAVARWGGTGLVAAVAAVMSYRHMRGLLGTWGEDALNASIGPLAVDGLMVVAAAALLALSERRSSR